MENFVQNTYNDWKETETALFQAYPLLKVGKAVTQGLALPALTAGAASYLPLAGPVISGAVHQGADFMQNHFHAFKENRIGEQFAELRNNIPDGWGHGMKVKAFDSWTKLRTADLLAKSDMLSRPITGYIGSSVVGKAILDTVPRIGGYVSQLPGSGAVGFVLGQSQAVIQKTQDFLTMVRQHVRAVGLDAETFIHQGFTKMSSKQEQNQGQSVSNDRVKPPSENLKVPDTVLNDAPTKLEPPSEKVRQAPPGLDVTPTPKQEPVPLKSEAPPTPVAENKPAQKSDDAALDYFMALASEMGGKNLNTERMKINFDGKDIFELSQGQAVDRRTAVSQEHMQAFQDALSDPKNFKGTLEIKQGNRVILSIKNGRVHDPSKKIKELLKVDIKTEADQVPQTTTEGFYKRHAQGVKANGIKGASQIAENALKAGHDQAEVVKMLTEHNPSIKRIGVEKGPEAAQKQALKSIEIGSNNLIMKDPEVQQIASQSQQQDQAQTHAPSL